jgi:predicted ATPase/DNA-binding CsgD family transcriptional regulator
MSLVRMAWISYFSGGSWGFEGNVLVTSERQPVTIDPAGAGTLGTNLSHPLTTFVGRAAELATVTRLLGVTRLVTVTGIGGSGKTRLAIEAGHSLLDRFPDGIRIVGLEDVRDPADVVAVFTEAVRAASASTLSIEASLLEHLRDRGPLLIVDGCESVGAESRRLCGALLATCPQLHIIATSRHPLGIGGEVVWPLPPLGLPDLDGALQIEELGRAESVQLFADRARESLGDFALTPANAETVARLCIELGGLPLAIELAAARLKVLTISQLASLVAGDRGFLQSARNPHGRRKETLEETIAGSYWLLEEPRREAVRRFSVFADGFDLEGAVAMLPPAAETTELAVEMIAMLLEHSLITVERREGEVRYRMLEPVRRYALKQLAGAEEEGEARRSHAEHYLNRLAAPTAEPSGVPPPGLHGADSANLRTAMAWARANGSDLYRRVNRRAIERDGIAGGLGYRLGTASAIPADAPQGIRNGTPKWAAPAAIASGLTKREWQILGLLVEGESNRAIAERLRITANTAGKHVAKVLQKLHSHSRAEAVATVLGHRVPVVVEPER